ncbi:MAG: DUF6390 family protein [Thaumarchaeota archaeon]|nr:DUF6390 family protein [Nitrososphaerota archaeon]
MDGELLHARHALQPNSLGYCGPDENGRILEHLHASSVTDDLTSTLTKFEAAYPFVRMIAKSTGMEPFDKEVTEAYWIGNSLLDKVEPADFFQFAHQGLGKRMKKHEARTIFRELGHLAKPHHTFYVLGMFARSNIKTANQEKLLELMDSCRVSWGRVLEVKPKTLVVDRNPLALEDEKLSLAEATKREVHYDRDIPPFSTVRRGDWISLHWNFASEKLTKHQLKNLVSYTNLDIEATNRIVAAIKPGTK